MANDLPPTPPPTEIDLLIVGTGPAGASLACFLASYGLNGLIIGATSSTADGPRAHITNAAALECLRDIGLEAEALKLASQGDTMMHTRWAHSMAGEEYARIYSWGNHPERKGEYEGASPCRHVDLPQTLLEPLLLRYATVNGFKCRMDTRFVSFIEDPTTDTITSTVLDILTGTKYTIKSKYLFAADGARSTIVKQLNLPLDGKPGDNLAIDVLVKADLSHLVEHRKGNLHWLIQPDVVHPEWGWLGVARMVKPWDEWVFSLFPSAGFEPKGNARPSDEEYLRRVREFIGDDGVEVRILRVSKWYINEIVARKYSRGKIFCLGDAVHRHPPMNGLGSNTCIQDSFNLAWKIAHVLRGHASPSLLASYTVERQPVGRGIIKRANDSFRNHSQIWEALGIMSPSVEERVAAMEELKASTLAGRERRKAFRDGIEYSAHEFHALGIEMNQHYESDAIYTEDEAEGFVFPGRAAEDPIMYYTPSAYPGSRLPHAWINSAKPGKAISTIDLAGKGAWTVFTGIGGDGWKAAAKVVGEELNVEVNAFSIGFRQDWEDVYFTWEKVRVVEEAGCLLVRPDRFVAWRSVEGGQEVERLGHVLRSILGLDVRH